jgi:hypothetical protein
VLNVTSHLCSNCVSCVLKPRILRYECFTERPEAKNARWTFESAAEQSVFSSPMLRKQFATLHMFANTTHKVISLHLLFTDVNYFQEVEVTLRPTVNRPFILGVRRPSGTRDQFYFLLEIFFGQLRFCNFVAPSLTRGWVCNLLVQLILGLARAVTLGSKSRRTHGHILLSSETPPTWRARFPYLYPPGTRWTSYTPGHWVPLLSPLTTRRDYGLGILTRLHTG